MTIGHTFLERHPLLPTQIPTCITRAHSTPPHADNPPQPSVSSTAGAQARFESWQREFGVAIHADEYEERQRIWESNSLIIEGTRG